MTTPFVITTTRLTSGLYQANLVDETGAAVPGSTLLGLTLTLKDLLTGATINSRRAQNVLNTNNVTVDVNGLLKWNWQDVDATIVAPESRLDTERHVATFHATWGSGGKGVMHEVFMDVQAMPLT